MIVEIFEILQRSNRTRNVRVQRRRRMTGKKQVMGLAERGNLQKTSDTSAPRHIGLQDIYRAGLDHFAEVEKIISVFSRRNFHAGRRALADRL